MKAAPIIALALVSACATSGGVSGSGHKRALVYVTANVRDAGVWVDDQFIGGLEMLRGGIAMRAGEHRLEIRHDQYFTHYAELAVLPGERRRLVVELSPILP